MTAIDLDRLRKEVEVKEAAGISAFMVETATLKALIDAVDETEPVVEDLPRFGGGGTVVRFVGLSPEQNAPFRIVVSTHSSAKAWNMTVGSRSVTVRSLPELLKHIGNFLRHAYQAGRRDERDAVRQRLGLDGD